MSSVDRTHSFVRSLALCAVAAFALAFLSPSTNACTVFRLKADDGSLLVTRSMEFAVDLKYDVVVVPRERACVSPAPDGKQGLSWKTRYGYVGVAALGLDYGATDGMNEKGLAVGMLWFESDMKWQSVGPDETQRALAQSMLADWILGSFADVEEVKREIRNVKVFKYTDPATGMALTVHFIVYDARGGCVVAEYEDGVCNVYDNPLGIMTNAPRFPWHLTNLRQYVGMTSEKPGAFQLAGATFPATGHGAGMVGLPGDITPPSRFVRLAALTRFSDKQPNAQKNLILAHHIINTFDIPFGMITDTMPDRKTVLKESTQWVTFRDLTQRVIYFKTYDNQNLRKIDLNKIDFTAPKLKRIGMFAAPEVLFDVTDQAR